VVGAYKIIGKNIREDNKMRPTKRNQTKKSDVNLEYKLKAMENIFTLVKYVIWPIIIIFILCRYKEPIDQIVNYMPKKIRYSDKISIGNISLEVGEIAKDTGDFDLFKAIEGLSVEALDALLRMPRNGALMLVCNNRSDNEYYVHESIEAIYELYYRRLIKIPKGCKGLDIIKKYNFKNSGKINILHQKLSETELKELDNVAVQLSPLGLDAVNIIIEYLSSKWK
jgi:hypothetical protein